MVLYITLFHVAGTMCSVLILGLHPCMPSYLLFVKLFHKSFIIQFVIDKATICHPSDSAYKGCCIACATDNALCLCSIESVQKCVWYKILRVVCVHYTMYHLPWLKTLRSKSPCSSYRPATFDQ